MGLGSGTPHTPTTPLCTSGGQPCFGWPLGHSRWVEALALFVAPLNMTPLNGLQQKVLKPLLPQTMLQVKCSCGHLIILGTALRWGRGSGHGLLSSGRELWNPVPDGELSMSPHHATNAWHMQGCSCNTALLDASISVLDSPASRHKRIRSSIDDPFSGILL